MTPTERIAKFMREQALAREDERVRAILGLPANSGMTNNIAPAWPMAIDADKLVDDLRRLALMLPKRERWFSTKLYPSADALRVEGSSANYLVARPSFWMNFQHHISRDQLPAALSPMPRYCGIEIEEIDPRDTDSEERAKHLADTWQDLIDAIKVACIELPDWLRAPPKFSRHG